MPDASMAQPATEAAALAPQSSYQEPPTYLESMATEPLSSAADADESPSASQPTSIEVTNDASTKTSDESNVDSKRRSVISDAKRDADVDVANVANGEDGFELLPPRNQSPNVVSISMLESAPNSVYLAMNTSPCGRHDHYAEDDDEDDDDEEEEEDENLSLTSPGTPCSQCLRDEEEATLHAAAKSARISAAAKKKCYNGGERSGQYADPDQPSSEECCSVESGSLCCNSSCCEEHQLVGGLTRRTVGGKRISLTEEAAAKLGHHRPSETSPATVNGSSGSDGGPRQLVTYVTPGLETVPLEMCQDIPDVMI